MAEQTYNPFSGFTTARNGPSKELGGKLHSVDWQQKRTTGDWVVFDAQKAAEEAKKRSAKVPAATGLSGEKAEEWRKANAVTVFGEDCPPPMPEFSMLTMLPPFIQKKFEAQGFKTPTAIQAQSWPILFQYRDFVGIAKTGSGKTLAFIVPAIVHIAGQQQLRPGDGPIVVVLAPTRELAQQIETETNKVLPTTMRCACIYGGSPKRPQLEALRAGVHILVATPGRLIDFLELRSTNLIRCTYLVLDEADRMLDMGFEPQVRKICSQIRPERQTLMFSATWPKEIQALAASFQKDFIRIHIGSTELLANPDVTQNVILVPEGEKLSHLRKLMLENKNRRVLVFCKTKKTADYLENKLKSMRFGAMAIHGDKEQRQREFILDRFRRESNLTLVATDVAARGLDIKELEVVINYDFPMQIDDYVHRIGRTGRAGAKGVAYTFITKGEEQLSGPVVKELIKILEKAQQTVPPFLVEWLNDLKFVPVKRPRDGRRGVPLMKYIHRSTPSFDPSNSGKGFLGAKTKSTTSFFGCGPGASTHTRFHDSDDDRDEKRLRTK